MLDLAGLQPLNPLGHQHDIHLRCPFAHIHVQVFDVLVSFAVLLSLKHILSSLPPKLLFWPI